MQVNSRVSTVCWMHTLCTLSRGKRLSFFSFFEKKISLGISPFTDTITYNIFFSTFSGHRWFLFVFFIQKLYQPLNHHYTSSYECTSIEFKKNTLAVNVLRVHKCLIEWSFEKYFPLFSKRWSKEWKKMYRRKGHRSGQFWIFCSIFYRLWNVHTHIHLRRNAMQIKDRAILNMQTCERCICMCAWLSVKQHISIEKNIRKRCRAMKLFFQWHFVHFKWDSILIWFVFTCSTLHTAFGGVRSLVCLLALKNIIKRTTTIVKFMNFHIDERANWTTRYIIILFLSARKILFHSIWRLCMCICLVLFRTVDFLCSFPLPMPYVTNWVFCAFSLDFLFNTL